MCINSTKGRFTVDRRICTLRKDILFCFSLSVVNDKSACLPFRESQKTSKCFGEVNKTKIINILPVVMKLKVR